MLCCKCVVIRITILLPLCMCICIQGICFSVQLELALCGVTEFRAVTDHYIDIPYQYINIPCVFSIFALTLKVHWRIKGYKSEQVQECTPLNFFWNLCTCTYICFHAGVALCHIYPLRRSTLSKRLQSRGIKRASDHVWALRNPGTMYPTFKVPSKPL